MAYTIEQIEDAILTALQGSSVLSAVCKTIATYHGEINELVKLVSQLTIPLPSLYTIYGGSSFAESANRSFDDEMNFTIVCITKDLRGGAELRASMYPILEEIKKTLIDNDLGLNIEPLHPVKIEATLITRILSIYSFDVKTLLSFSS